MNRSGTSRASTGSSADRRSARSPRARRCSARRRARRRRRTCFTVPAVAIVVAAAPLPSPLPVRRAGCLLDPRAGGVLHRRPPDPFSVSASSSPAWSPRSCSGICGRDAGVDRVRRHPRRHYGIVYNDPRRSTGELDPHPVLFGIAWLAGFALRDARRAGRGGGAHVRPKPSASARRQPASRSPRSAHASHASSTTSSPTPSASWSCR